MKEIIYIPLVLISMILFTEAVYADLNDGLVAYYPFEGDVNDESGLNNHGTVFGNIEYVNGIQNEAAYFKDSYVLVSHNDTISFYLGKDYSISIWVSLDNNIPIGKYSKIIFKGIAGIGANYTVELCNNMHPCGKTIFSNSDTSICYDFPVQSWMHIVTLFNKQKNKFEIYINGEQKILNSSGTRNFRTSFTPLTIGGGMNPYSNSEPWSGKIDEFRIYNRALSVAEIQELYNQGLVGFSEANEIDLNVSFYNSEVAISWETANHYSGYRLLYAPYPEANYVSEIDMGVKTKLKFNASNLAFYVAVQPYEQNTISNIEYFNCNEIACNEFIDNSDNFDGTESEIYSMPIVTGNYAKFKVTTNSGVYYSTNTITEVGSTYYIEKTTFSNRTGYTLTRYVLQNNRWKRSKMESYDSGIKSSTTTFSPYVNLLPSTIEIGSRDVQSYTATNSYNSTDYNSTQNQQQTLTVQSLERIVVPAGTFDTVKINTKINTTSSLYSASSQSDSWYAKGIGMVKFYPSQDQYYLAELHSYHFQ